MRAYKAEPSPPGDGTIPDPPVKKPSRFKRPVTWLLGSTLLRHAGWIVINSVFGRRLGGIDWMRPEPHLTIEKEAYAHAAEAAAGDTAGSEELWFDYIADSGDSQKTMYSMAYLCLSDLWVEEARDGNPTYFYDAPNRLCLRRGQFLFVGGDTAYHVSNYRTLRQRFRDPFCWAQKDLEDKGRAAASRPSRLYAIPGNHDYYDALNGFNRQFRRPNEGTRGLLAIPSFEREQDASYVALELPFGWWFLGLDTTHGEMDFRQRTFFQKLLAEHDPKKLILAMPEPTTAFDRRARPDAPLVKILADEEDPAHSLQLPTPFLDEQPALPAGRCRLDLAGDVHHYARYWGPPESARYASVVCGLGGAFLHPTHTTRGPLAAAKKYPPEDRARREVNTLLFQMHPVLGGGNIPLLGALLGLVMFFAWRAPGTDSLLAWLVGGLERACGLMPSVAVAGPRVAEASASFIAATPSFIDRLLALTSAGFWSLVLCITGAVGAFSALGRHAHRVQYGNKALRRPWIGYLGFLLVALAPFAPKLPWLVASTAPLTQSAVLFLCTIIGATVVGAAVWHHEILDERAAQTKRLLVTPLDEALSLFIAVCGFVSMAGAFWLYGAQPASTVMLHQTFLALVLLCMVGLTVKAWTVGAYWRGLGGKLGFLLLGLWHGVLQLCVPLLWAHHGLSRAAVVYAPLLVAASWLGYRLARRKPTAGAQAALVLLWVFIGATSLALPICFPDTTAAGGLWPHLQTIDALRWFLPAGNQMDDAGFYDAAGVVLFAACASGVWFSWYLAVSLALGGHNNEAGSATRIDRFGALVRIRLTPETLTAYVIAIDQVETDGERLKPRLVDVFTLRAQK